MKLDKVLFFLFLQGLGGAKTGGFGGFGTQTGSTPASGGLSSLAGGFGGQTGGTLPNFGGTAATGTGSGFSFSSKTSGNL